MRPEHNRGSHRTGPRLAAIVGPPPVLADFEVPVMGPVVRRSAPAGDVAEAGPFTAAIAALMADRAEWSGTASDLLAECEAMAEDLRLDTDSEAWPGSPQWAAERLRGAEISLRETGINMAFNGDGRRRTIQLSREQ